MNQKALPNIYKDLDADTLKNLDEALNHPINLQIFKTSIINGKIEESRKIHKIQILMSIVYSKFSEMKSSEYGDSMYCMSGFNEKEGRLPNKYDKIRIIRGRYYFTEVGDYILSEIGFEIVNNKL